MNRAARRLVAALLLGPALAAAAHDDDGAFLADASSLPLPTYGMQALTGRATDEARVEFAGLSINGSEHPHGIGIVHDGARTRVGLESLLAELGLVARRDGADARVQTPLGNARVALGNCLAISGAHYCDAQALGEALALEILFDGGEYLVRVRSAWPRAGGDAVKAPPPIADVEAPLASISHARSRFDYRHDGNGGDFYGSGEFGGGLGDGYWRSAWFHDGSGRRGLFDYAWISQRGNTRMLLGHQIMGLDPLLPGFDLLGAQAAWTNAPRAVFTDAPETRRLVSDRVLPDRMLRGEGPPGGRAELYVNNVLVDSTPIALDGRYVLNDTGPRVDALAVVQVHLYEHAFDSVPLRIEDRSFQTGERLLADGTLVQFAGAGVQGNPLGDSTLGGELDGKAAGFWQMRYGVSPAVTVETAVQHAQDGSYAIGGVHLGLGGFGTLSALAGRNDDGAGALRVQTEGQRRQWFWRGYLQDEDAGYRSGAGERELRYAESGWLGRRWMVSLVARSERDLGTGREIDYVKPALSVQPADRLSFAVRPDSEGDYTWLARWVPAARVMVSAFRDARRDQVEAQWSPNSDTRFVAGWVREDAYGDRHSLVGYRARRGARAWHYGAGALEADGRLGWLLEVGAQLGSGSTLSAQALDDPLQASAGGSGRTLWLNLGIDLVNTGRGFTQASWRADYSNRGSVAGRIDLPGDRAGETLAGIPVRVDGDIRAYTDAHGRFHVGGLAPGVHRIELDDENLPIDFVPEKRGMNVEVAAGRATTLRFTLDLRLGMAGRTLGANGKAAGGILVRLLDRDGRELARQSSDNWGFYRFTELPPGTYHVAAGESPQRPVELVDRHVFDQDLVVNP